MPRSYDASFSAPAGALLALVLVVSLVPVGLLATPAAAASASERYVVGFYEMPDERERYLGERVETVGEELAFFTVDTDEPHRFRQEAEQDDRVRYVEEDHRELSLAYTPDDPRFSDQYGPQVTWTDTAWDTTTGSRAVVVGFLDSGIHEGHTDLEDDRVHDGWDYVNDDGTPEDAAACNHHGSHVAGIAAATIDNGEGIAGVAQASILMHKVFDGDGTGDCQGAFASDFADALTDLADAGAHVSSNSWTAGRSSTVLDDAIDEAHSKGVIHVAAAGNEGPCSDCVQPPWRDQPGRVVIASCTDADDGFCSFSSQGPEVDLAAPGSHVLSVDGGTSSGYVRMSGTSMSAPHVSGAIGLYLAHHGGSSFDVIEDGLVDTAEDVGLAEAEQGGGRLDTHTFLAAGGDGLSAAFTLDCQHLSCTFDAGASSAGDGEITSYDWQLGDGSTATGEVVDHTYVEAGEHAVTLTVTDDEGQEDEAEKIVTVEPPPLMHVHAIDHRASGLDVEATVTIFDATEAPVLAADVTIQTCNAADVCQTWVETTDLSGEATATWRAGLAGPYTSCVLALDHHELEHAPEEAHARDGSCASDTVWPLDLGG